MKSTLRPTKVLVIEDNPSHWFFIKNALQQVLSEVELRWLQTEEEVMAFLNTCSVAEWELPNLILLDLYLPDRATGWRILREIKTLPEPGSQVPVVLLSTSEQADDIAQTYQFGCASYLVKPHSFPEWVAQLEAFCSYWLKTAALPA